MTKYSIKDEIQFLKVNGFRLKAIRGDHHKFQNKHGLIAELNYTSLKDTVSPGVHKDVRRAVNGKSKWQGLGR